jgi:hypothetical protein
VHDLTPSWRDVSAVEQVVQEEMPKRIVALEEEQHSDAALGSQEFRSYSGIELQEFAKGDAGHNVEAEPKVVIGDIRDIGTSGDEQRGALTRKAKLGQHLVGRVEIGRFDQQINVAGRPLHALFAAEQQPVDPSLVERPKHGLDQSVYLVVRLPLGHSALKIFELRDHLWRHFTPDDIPR